MSYSLRIQSNQKDRLNSFISKLSYIFNINNIKKEGWSKIHGWSDCKKCIKIFDKDKFLEKIISQFFSHRKMGSFLRQLNLYNFKKAGRENIYYNSDFVVNRNGNINQTKLERIVRKGYKSSLELNAIESIDSYDTNQNNSVDSKMKRKTGKRKLGYCKLKPKFSEDIYENKESQSVKRSKRIKEKYEKKCKEDINRLKGFESKDSNQSIYKSESNNKYDNFSDLSSLSTDSEDTDTIFESFKNRNSKDFVLTEYNKDLFEDVYNQDYDNREFYYSNEGIDKDISEINFIEDDINFLDSVEKNNPLFFHKCYDRNAKHSKYSSDIDYYSLLNYIES